MWNWTGHFGLGQDIQHKSDLTCFVKWPHYSRLQQQKATLSKQLKVPSVIKQCTKALDHQRAKWGKLAGKYKPETKQEKQQQLLAWDKKKAKRTSH
ncbi:60S ribosomal protein L7A [Saguinus oedipus]|uniref:60S ribosomal protein L7a n=1 Tax=Saguinus oedipus TaxID=9490 RepID=A0ABQ9W3I5_SAGOE|nr:60S ribosomal protein L7A [Saguinus oedipus]